MALDGTLMFGTGVDNSGFNKGINTLQIAAGTALGNIASEITGKLSELAARIPAEMVSIGSGFEASMSQVAATMGITSAAAEFDTLSDAAKEMGETTKFSASQAGEALNYLALAGYDAEKAVSALPTVLNVAAAGGMELAAASDMITDAMSALGLQTSQMADFSDKLAVTAQKSNTSVSQLGEAILTVGGTAKSLAGGVTEMNTVLGILADNGIKGAEGGTMLRNVILSLSAPTSTAAAALSELGVTAFDASGSMRPLEDTFADLNAALSKLSDQEKTAVLNEIFNKVDLKGVNALLGTSAERFDELSGYIDSCSGAAADMAATMDDYIEKLRLEAKVRNMQPAYDEAIAQQEKYNDKRLELENELSKKIEAFQSAESNDVKGVFAVQIGGLREEIATLDETYEMGKEIISEYESLFSDGSKSSPLADYYRRQGEQAYNAQREATEELALSQEEATEKLTQGWKSAEHNYAIGVIGSQEELYAEKQRLWNEYGSADLEEHWQYYEDLIGYQQDYAKQSADEYRSELEDRFNAVEHRLNLGLISEEDAYKAKLDLIQKYCPEYSDEWYSYYKDVYDYQREYADKQLDELKNSIRDQIDAVKSGLKDILSEYNSKYKDIQSNIDSFKNKLLSLGEAFSVITNEDGSKALKVNDLTNQMAEMRKYTEYVKKLKAEGASQGLIEELTSMDAADGMEFAKNLANMSDTDFTQVNDFYKARDELAQELAEDLYAPDVSALNEKLVSDITEQFGMLPEEIRAIGAESLNAFIAGLGSGDLSEQAESFIDSFGTELDNGLAAVFENLDEDISKSIGDNVYEVGKTSGEDFVQGFNEALAGLEAAFLSEQSRITAEYSVSGSVGAVSQSSGDSKPIRIENKVDVTLEVDGDKIAQKTITYTNDVNQRSGK